MKLIYRILILLAIFLGSLTYFGMNMEEQIFHLETKTMEMENAKLPYVTLFTEGQEINLLHGYCSGLDVLTVRESITPINSSQELSILITEKESVVKKLKYEVISVEDGNTLEEGSSLVFDKEQDYKVARLKFKEALSKDTEYVLRITLITDQSKRIYYYTRVKVMDQSYVTEKLAFVSEFHNATFDKDNAGNIEKYLETKRGLEEKSFAKVNINSGLDMVTYGSLKPKKIYMQVPTITEISKDTASVMIKFIVSIETGSGLEYFTVEENYRFQYTQNRTYLYNYDREMEAIFDVDRTSLAKSEFKLGITNQPEVEVIANQDKSVIAFVRGRELWSYNLAENTMVRVFSFYQNQTDFVRDTFDQHDIKILKMDEAGNIDFLVYGYMNRGEYEGRVGLILYTYDKTLGRIEEQIYIPINTTYNILKEEIGSLCYRNDFDVFYLHIFDTIYSYNLTTKVLKTIATNVPKKNLYFSLSNTFIVYKEDKNSEEDKIHVLNLESGAADVIYAQRGQKLKLLGLIDNNIIYGKIKNSDIAVHEDGTVLEPMYEVLIVDSLGNVKKQYAKDGYFVTDANVENNVVELTRVEKDNSVGVGYRSTEPDYILNQFTSANSSITVTKRVTENMLTEYYLSLGRDYVMEKLPETKTTVNTIITEDTTVRVSRPEDYRPYYIAYSYGKIIEFTSDAGKAIQAADEQVGIVIDHLGKVIWQRGAKPSKMQLTEVSQVTKESGFTSLQACMRMLLLYKNADVNTSSYNKNEQTAIEYLKSQMKATPVELRGITLDEVLYFVGKQRPVIAFKDMEEAVVITGYDSTSVMVLDPSSRGERRWTLKQAEETFEKAGSVYITYVE
ncbi:hypothetical protein [Lachnoclostridium phytofermentans]|uniref:hypothetical protein n=1 Tax=Lachnoclostridium phytofermentans TaxID=66219 RepID=UPI00049839CA|nr:hypothetical protein [Lachnoclostridium phytofermentans]